MKTHAIALLEALGWLLLYFLPAFILSLVFWDQSMKDLLFGERFFRVSLFLIVLVSVPFFRDYRRALRKIRRKESTVESLSNQ